MQNQLFKTPIIRHNGACISRDESTQHTVNHALHYGSGVFEGIRFYSTDQGSKIFKLQEHIHRLFYSASVFSMKIPYSEEELQQACKEVVEKSGEEEGYIRPIITFGTGPMGLFPKPELTVEVMISVWKRGKYLSENAIDVKISRVRRIDPATTDMNAKITGNYANSIYANMDTRAVGYDEGLLLDTRGYIAEGPGENIFFIKGEEVYTPAEGTILPGITRATVIDLFNKEFDILVQEVNIHPDELGDFDEAFFVGTAAEVTPIGSITDQKEKKTIYTSGEETSLTVQMKDVYEDVVRGKIEEYVSWLS